MADDELLPRLDAALVEPQPFFEVPRELRKQVERIGTVGIDIERSSTRREELLLGPDLTPRVWLMRRITVRPHQIRIRRTPIRTVATPSSLRALIAWLPE